MEHNGPSTLPCRTPIVTWTLVTSLPRLFRICSTCLRGLPPIPLTALSTLRHLRPLPTDDPSEWCQKLSPSRDKKPARRQLRRLAWWFELVNLSNTFPGWLLHLACFFQGASQIGMVGMQPSASCYLQVDDTMPLPTASVHGEQWMACASCIQPCLSATAPRCPNFISINRTSTPNAWTSLST